jgi:hypothetical protein
MTLHEVILILCLLESNNDPNAIGDTDRGDQCARGILQIRPCVIADVNRKYRTSYTVADCFDIEKSQDIALKYLLMYCGPTASLDTYVRTWNGGPRGARKACTLAYWHRFKLVMNNVA